MDLLKARKIIGGFLIALGLLLSTPPFIPTFFDDLINIGIAILLVNFFVIDKVLALFITYTLIPFILILVGLYIEPEEDGKTITKVIRKTKKFLKWYFKKLTNIKFLVINVIALIILYYIYSLFLVAIQF